MSVWINPHLPVETAAELPKFCGVCGRAMAEDRVKLGHNRQTGQRIEIAGVKCPKGRFDNHHEAYVVSPRPVSPPMPR